MFVWVFQIKEVQQTVTEKTSSLEGEAFKTKRLQEELGLVKRKVERLRKIEMATDTNMDQILKEEVREYKETLTCPSCKVKRKDAVLTKCFHCFCYDCLRTRFVYHLNKGFIDRTTLQSIIHSATKRFFVSAMRISLL